MTFGSEFVDLICLIKVYSKSFFLDPFLCASGYIVSHVGVKEIGLVR
jgi:hypothetical protein